MPSKSLYHSVLVKNGRTTLDVLSDLLPSKFNPGQFQVKVRLGNEELYFTLENESCADAMNGMNGKTVEVDASGTREGAELLVNPVGEARPAAPKKFPQPYNGPRRGASGSQTSSKPTGSIDDFAAKCGWAYLVALQAANRVKAAWQSKAGLAMSDDQFQACVSSIFIQMSSSRRDVDYISNVVIPAPPKPPMAKPAPVARPPIQSEDVPTEVDDIPF